jgi:drug/metabolite transporter (DMT)-like permease
MTPIRIIGIVLIVAGGLALAYGGFSYTKEEHKGDIGPFKFSVQEREQVNVPQWIGVGALVAGIVLVVMGKDEVAP